LPVVSASLAANSTGDRETLELFAAQGLTDVVWVEMEHGGTDWGELGDIARACDLWGVTSLIRVMRNDSAEIGRALDRGMQSVLVPHVTTREQAERIVNASLYAPEGERGAAFPRQSYGVPDYLATANEEVLIVALLEDIEAFENLDDILQVDRIDCFFIGPVDLAQTMGAEYLGQPFHPDVQTVVRDGIVRIVAAGSCAGTLVNDENVAEFLSAGVRFLRLAALSYMEDGLKEFHRRVADTSERAAALSGPPVVDRI
jgi:2-keto-3-deoxy-L-rhamnonate aldolase RhmA